ncbi:EF-hand domain-containing protein [Herbidospora mongoliensis]|uniref:EF-hand domain-containing protein n=1 Tax=Herbidospora mongoliensis TaxID=688067 RepID=UPI000831AE2A|nr:EF-hand domain-containing protein [Herbidospora mongoliensis]
MTFAVPDALARKFDKRFALFDADGDGVLTKDDFEAAATRFLAAFDVPADSAEGRDVLAAYAGMWNALIHSADVDSDGRLSRDEFVAYLAGDEFRAHGYAVTAGRVAESVLAVCDSDGDGRISYDEFAAIPGISALPDGERREVFTRLDTDGSGHLDIGEIHAAQRDFYHSTDPDAPGNLIFGQL